jgi:hypothetical protein
LGLLSGQFSGFLVSHLAADAPRHRPLLQTISIAAPQAHADDS